MSKVELRHKSQKFCLMCGKSDTVSLNRPHSLHKTKRVVKPNLQKKWGYVFCQNCFRNLKKNNLDLGKKTLSNQEA